MRSSPSKADPLAPSWLGFAHRGLHGPGIPENSLAAFRAAIKFTCGAECDVRLSRDGVPIVFHDADLRRLCASGARIDDRDGDWLTGQSLLDSDQTIPTLGDLLRLWPAHLPLLIECKTWGDDSARLAQAVVAALRERPRTAGIMSFDPAVPRWLEQHAPDLPRGLVVDGDWRSAFRAAAAEHARPTFIAVDTRLLGDPWVAAMRGSMPVYCWTVRSPEQWAQAKVHADALIWEGDGRP